MNACEYLARVGFAAILGGRHTTSDDEDDPASIEAARLEDHRIVRDMLVTRKALPRANRDGCSWMREITWPDRVPGLKTWSGQMTLPKTIARLQAQVEHRTPTHVDLYEFRCGLSGASGIDDRSCPNALDIGFSLNALDMAVEQRPALELLAIVGAEVVPLVSFARRECGFFHGGRLWRFTVEKRDGGYLRRWGELRAVPDAREQDWREAWAVSDIVPHPLLGRGVVPIYRD